MFVIRCLETGTNLSVSPSTATLVPSLQGIEVVIMHIQYMCNNTTNVAEVQVASIPRRCVLAHGLDGYTLLVFDQSWSLPSPNHTGYRFYERVSGLSQHALPKCLPNLSTNFDLTHPRTWVEMTDSVKMTWPGMVEKWPNYLQCVDLAMFSFLSHKRYVFDLSILL